AIASGFRASAGSPIALTNVRTGLAADAIAVALMKTYTAFRENCHSTPRATTGTWRSSARYPPAFRPQRAAGALLGADKVSAWEDGRIGRHEFSLACGLRRYVVDRGKRVTGSQRNDPFPARIEEDVSGNDERAGAMLHKRRERATQLAVAASLNRNDLL